MRLDNGRGGEEMAAVVLASGLPACSPNLVVGFTRWRVIKREGDKVHVLQEVDAEAKP